ncbi:MAG: TSUP family transporter, partial [Pseudomonadota bacterium]|nr:TSUP family transporter [Pseudomonadota bacterium]
MDSWELLYFSVMVVIATAVQTITGFALGLILVALCTAFGIMSVIDCAAIVSLVSMMNTGLLLRRSYRDLNRGVVMAIMVGLIPTLLLGFYWLDQVGRDQVSLLRTIIGAMVLVAGTTLMLRPSPYSSLSAKPLFFGSGLIGGLFGGLFSAAGAPIAYLMYRQPLAISVIRSSLLAVFFLSTFVRAVTGGF